MNNNKTEEQGQGMGLKTVNNVRTTEHTIEKEVYSTLSNLKLRNIMMD